MPLNALVFIPENLQQDNPQDPELILKRFLSQLEQGDTCSLKPTRNPYLQVQEDTSFVNNILAFKSLLEAKAVKNVGIFLTKKLDHIGSKIIASSLPPIIYYAEARVNNVPDPVIYMLSGTMMESILGRMPANAYMLMTGSEISTDFICKAADAMQRWTGKHPIQAALMGIPLWMPLCMREIAFVGELIIDTKALLHKAIRAELGLMWTGLTFNTAEMKFYLRLQSELLPDSWRLGIKTYMGRPGSLKYRFLINMKQYVFHVGANLYEGITSADTNSFYYYGNFGSNTLANSNRQISYQVNQGLVGSSAVGTDVDFNEVFDKKPRVQWSSMTSQNIRASTEEIFLSRHSNSPAAELLNKLNKHVSITSTVGGACIAVTLPLSWPAAAAAVVYYATLRIAMPWIGKYWKKKYDAVEKEVNTDAKGDEEKGLNAYNSLVHRKNSLDVNNPTKSISTINQILSELPELKKKLAFYIKEIQKKKTHVCEITFGPESEDKAKGWAEDGFNLRIDNLRYVKNNKVNQLKADLIAFRDEELVPCIEKQEAQQLLTDDPKASLDLLSKYSSSDKRFAMLRFRGYLLLEQEDEAKKYLAHMPSDEKFEAELTLAYRKLERVYSEKLDSFALLDFDPEDVIALKMLVNQLELGENLSQKILSLSELKADYSEAAFNQEEIANLKIFLQDKERLDLQSKLREHNYSLKNKVEHLRSMQKSILELPEATTSKSIDNKQDALDSIKRNIAINLMKMGDFIEASSEMKQVKNKNWDDKALIKDLHDMSNVNWQLSKIAELEGRELNELGEKELLEVTLRFLILHDLLPENTNIQLELERFSTFHHKKKQQKLVNFIYEKTQTKFPSFIILTNYLQGLHAQDETKLLIKILENIDYDDLMVDFRRLPYFFKFYQSLSESDTVTLSAESRAQFTQAVQVAYTNALAEVMHDADLKVCNPNKVSRAVHYSQVLHAAQESMTSLSDEDKILYGVLKAMQPDNMDAESYTHRLILGFSQRDFTDLQSGLPANFQSDEYIAKIVRDTKAHRQAAKWALAEFIQSVVMGGMYFSGASKENYAYMDFFLEVVSATQANDNPKDIALIVTYRFMYAYYAYHGEQPPDSLTRSAYTFFYLQGLYRFFSTDLSLLTTSETYQYYINEIMLTFQTMVISHWGMHAYDQYCAKKYGALTNDRVYRFMSGVVKGIVSSPDVQYLLMPTGIASRLLSLIKFNVFIPILPYLKAAQQLIVELPILGSFATTLGAGLMYIAQPVLWFTAGWVSARILTNIGVSVDKEFYITEFQNAYLALLRGDKFEAYQLLEKAGCVDKEIKLDGWLSTFLLLNYKNYKLHHECKNLLYTAALLSHVSQYVSAEEREQLLSFNMIFNGLMEILNDYHHLLPDYSEEESFSQEIKEKIFEISDVSRKDPGNHTTYLAALRAFEVAKLDQENFSKNLGEYLVALESIFSRDFDNRYFNQEARSSLDCIAGLVYLFLEDIGRAKQKQVIAADKTVSYCQELKWRVAYQKLTTAFNKLASDYNALAKLNLQLNQGNLPLLYNEFFNKFEKFYLGFRKQVLPRKTGSPDIYVSYLNTALTVLDTIKTLSTQAGVVHPIHYNKQAAIYAMELVTFLGTHPTPLFQDQAQYVYHLMVGFLDNFQVLSSEEQLSLINQYRVLNIIDQILLSNLNFTSDDICCLKAIMFIAQSKTLKAKQHYNAAKGNFSKKMVAHCNQLVINLAVPEYPVWEAVWEDNVYLSYEDRFRGPLRTLLDVVTRHVLSNPYFISLFGLSYMISNGFARDIVQQVMGVEYIENFKEIFYTVQFHQDISKAINWLNTYTCPEERTQLAHYICKLQKYSLILHVHENKIKTKGTENILTLSELFQQLILELKDHNSIEYFRKEDGQLKNDILSSLTLFAYKALCLYVEASSSLHKPILIKKATQLLGVVANVAFGAYEIAYIKAHLNMYVGRYEAASLLATTEKLSSNSLNDQLHLLLAERDYQAGNYYQILSHLRAIYVTPEIYEIHGDKLQLHIAMYARLFEYSIVNLLPAHHYRFTDVIALHNSILQMAYTLPTFIDDIVTLPHAEMLVYRLCTSAIEIISLLSKTEQQAAAISLLSSIQTLKNTTISVPHDILFAFQLATILGEDVLSCIESVLYYLSGDVTFANTILQTVAVSSLTSNYHCALVLQIASAAQHQNQQKSASATTSDEEVTSFFGQLTKFFLGEKSQSQTTSCWPFACADASNIDKLLLNKAPVFSLPPIDDQTDDASLHKDTTYFDSGSNGSEAHSETAAEDFWHCRQKQQKLICVNADNTTAREVSRLDSSVPWNEIKEDSYQRCEVKYEGPTKTIRHCVGVETEFVEYTQHPEIEPSLVSVMGYSALNGAVMAALPEALGDALEISGYCSARTANYMKMTIATSAVLVTGGWMSAVVNRGTAFLARRAGFSDQHASVAGNSAGFFINIAKNLTPIGLVSTAANYAGGYAGMWLEKKVMQQLKVNTPSHTMRAS